LKAAQDPAASFKPPQAWETAAAVDPLIEERLAA